MDVVIRLDIRGEPMEALLEMIKPEDYGYELWNMDDVLTYLENRCRPVATADKP